MNVSTEPKQTAELFSNATDAFYDENYDEALTLFTELIGIEPGNADFLLKRCQVHQKLNKLECALEDGKNALRLLEQGSGSLLARAHLQVGITLHRLDRFTEAQASFEQSEKLNPSAKTLGAWLRKNKEKLPKVEERPKAEEKPEAVHPTPLSSPSKKKFDWFQKDTFVTIEVFLKKVNPDNVVINFYERSLSLSVKLANETDFSLELDPLAHAIVPKESSYKVFGTKIEIKLKKEFAMMWGALESNNDIGTTAKPKKDWNKLSKEVDEDTTEGDQALNSLFQNIYKNADPDTQRAMMKSFVESNGTCLSTNWSEIGANKTNVMPPDGMVEKKYQ